MTGRDVIAKLEQLWKETDKAGRDAILGWIAENKDNRPPEDFPLVPTQRHEELARARRIAEIGDFINRMMRADPDTRLSREAFAEALGKELEVQDFEEAWKEYLLWGQVDGWTYREAIDAWERA